MLLDDADSSYTVPVGKDNIPPILRGIIVLGTVNSKERCPKCFEKFLPVHQDGTGIYCPTCLTKPERFYINAYPFGLKHIYSDPKTHKPFTKYKEAMDVLIDLNKAWRQAIDTGKPFNGDAFTSKKIIQKQIDNIIKDRLEFYKLKVARGLISHSRCHNVEASYRYITEHFGDRNIHDVDLADLEQFLKFLMTFPISSRYIDDIMMEFKSLLLRHRPDNMPEWPTFTVKATREKQRLGLTREMAALEKVPDRHGYRIAILILLRTGIRIDEVRGLKKHDLQDGEIHVTKVVDRREVILRTKTGANSIHRVSPEIWQLLMEHCKNLSDDDLLFTHKGAPLGNGRLYKVWVKACRDAGVKHICLQQASRHSTATETMKEFKKKAMEEIAKKLSHFNKQTQKNYIVEDET